MEYLCDRADHPEEESTAREFCRFIQEKNWQITNASRTHPFLNSPPGENLSQAARFQQDLAQCIYGLAWENSDRVVVLVSNNRSLTTKIEELAIKNIATISAANLRQWSRTKQLPPSISYMIGEIVKSNKLKINKAVAEKKLSRSSSRVSPLRIPPSHTPERKKINILSLLISSISAIAGFTIAGLLIWSLVEPASFNKFLQEHGLPTINNSQ